MSHAPFEIIYPPKVFAHFDAIALKYHSLIRREIHQQLGFEPLKETRNKKPVRGKNELGAEWEIRFGPDNRFRVLYNVNGDSRLVEILAIGVKYGNRLFVGGEEMKL